MKETQTEGLPAIWHGKVFCIDLNPIFTEVKTNRQTAADKQPRKF
jgi:hypothetical protein